MSDFEKVLLINVISTYSSFLKDFIFTVFLLMESVLLETSRSLYFLLIARRLSTSRPTKGAAHCTFRRAL